MKLMLIICYLTQHIQNISIITCNQGFPCGSGVKNLPAMQKPQETQVWSLSQEDPLEEDMATHSSILAWRTPWTEEPGGLQSMRSQSWTRLSDFTSLLHSIFQQIWKTQQWPQDWKRSVFIPMSKKGNSKESSGYHKIKSISHLSKVVPKILQERLHWYVKRELPDVQAGIRKGRGTRV